MFASTFCLFLLLAPNEADSLVRFGTIPFKANIENVTINIPTELNLAMNTKPDGIHVVAEMTADLTDLQGKIAQIIDTIPLPRDNCKCYCSDNLVVRLDNKSLKASNGKAELTLKGRVSVWSCFENPLGSPFKNRIIDKQRFTATLRFSVFTPDNKTIEIKHDEPDIHLSGNVGRALQTILGNVGVDLNKEASAALKKSMDPEPLKGISGDELKDLKDLHIDYIRFENNNNPLKLKTRFRATVSPEMFAKLLAAKR